MRGNFFSLFFMLCSTWLAYFFGLFLSHEYFSNMASTFLLPWLCFVVAAATFVLLEASLNSLRVHITRKYWKKNHFFSGKYFLLIKFVYFTIFFDQYLVLCFEA